MRTIPLTQELVTVVDDGDYGELAKYNWHTLRAGGNIYAVRSEPMIAGQRRGTILMHRMILNPPSGTEVDHIDGNGLNNSLSNLRLASHSLNSRNSYRRRATKLGLPRGVRRHHRKYWAGIKINGQSIYLGMCDTAEEAHAVYCAAKVRSIQEAVVSMDQ